MDFLNPILLYGTLGISIPVLIHLLNRYRHREMEWAAMDLLRRAIHIRSRQIRLEDLLLLLLRCLAVILIAVALARPTVRTTGGQWMGGESRGIIIGLDASYSMTHRQGVKDRFAVGIQNVRDILSTLNPGDPVSLMLMGSRPRILFRNMGYDPARLEEILDLATPLEERMNLEVCLEEVQSVVNEMKAARKECYLVTDAQRVTWENLSEKTKNIIDEIGKKNAFFAVSCGSNSTENLALTRFELVSGTLRKGSVARYVADVRNFGNSPLENVGINLAMDGKTIDRRVLNRIKPGETVSVPLFAHFKEPGVVQLASKLSQPDQLKVDNSRFAVAYVRDVIRILCVDGDPSEDRFKSETDYLVTALLPKRRGTSSLSLDIKVVSWLELHSQRLTDYQVIILANVRDVHETRVTGLIDFVDRGGGLLVFLGDQIIPDLLNARMQKDDTTLFPCEVLEAVGDPNDRSKGKSLAPNAPEHPLAQPLKMLPRALLSQALFFRHFKVKLHEGARSILDLAGNAGPLLVEKEIGHGKVLLFTSTADRKWNNIVVHPIYPLLLHQAVAYLTGNIYEQQFTVGEPIVLPLPVRTAERSILFVDPNGREISVQVSQRGSERVVELSRPEWSGFYEGMLNGGRGRSRKEQPDTAAKKRNERKTAWEFDELVIATNVDAAESAVESLRENEFGQVLKDLPINLLSSTQGIMLQIQESRIGREFWRPLLIAGLLMLLLEFYLANRFSRKMEGQTAPQPLDARKEFLNQTETVQV